MSGRAMTERQRRLKVALAVAGKSPTQFAAEIDYSAAYVSSVVHGRIESPLVLAAVDAFIDAHYPQEYQQGAVV